MTREWALRLAHSGLAVFPCGTPRGGSHGHTPGSDSDCVRCKAEKRPMISDWPNRATSDPKVIAAHWPPDANIGIGCMKSGLLVIDLDRHNPEADGVDAFTALCEKRGFPWPSTFTVPTPGDGIHLYYWAPAARPLGNSAGRLGPGIDTRGPGAGNSGGYVLGPGSAVGGKPYTVTRDAPIEPLPDWIADLLDPPRPAPKPIGRTPRIDDRYLAAAVKGEIERVLAAVNGTRNDTLNTAAFNLGTIIGAGLLDAITAETALYAAADAIGLVAEDGDRQTRATIASGLNSGTKNPRRIRGNR